MGSQRVGHDWVTSTSYLEMGGAVGVRMLLPFSIWFRWLANALNILETCYSILTPLCTPDGRKFIRAVYILVVGKKSVSLMDLLNIGSAVWPWFFGKSTQPLLVLRPPPTRDPSLRVHWWATHISRYVEAAIRRNRFQPWVGLSLQFLRLWWENVQRNRWPQNHFLKPPRDPRLFPKTLSRMSALISSGLKRFCRRMCNDRTRCSF